jgi:hypothetical protein
LIIIKEKCDRGVGEKPRLLSPQLFGPLGQDRGRAARIRKRSGRAVLTGAGALASPGHKKT